MTIKFTDMNLPSSLVEASKKLLLEPPEEKEKEPKGKKGEEIVIDPEIHNMDTVQRLQMGDEPAKEDSKEKQKEQAKKKHEIWEDGKKLVPGRDFDLLSYKKGKKPVQSTEPPEHKRKLLPPKDFDLLAHIKK